MLNLSAVQDMFVQRLPALRKTARINFRHLPPELKEESITNAIALAWKGISRSRHGRAVSEEHGISTP